MSSLPADFPTVLADTLAAPATFVSLVFSRPCPGCDVSPKQTVRPVEVRGELRFQWTSRRGAQEFHENRTAAETRQRAVELWGGAYLHAHLFTTTQEIAARIDRRGEVHLTCRAAARGPAEVAHDRAKRRLIPEGVPCPFLAAIGVMTPQGQVRPRQQHKFRQINRYLEFVDDVLAELPAAGPLEVVDCGCGKSGLTFALQHLLRTVAKREAHVVGLDRNPAVIATCRELAGRLSLPELEFASGDIASYQPTGPVHLVVSLHACDTATDHALARAVSWGTDVILAVPCCQHELAPQLEAAGCEAFLSHGILRERFAADLTDALRAALLEVVGYSTQIVEFIELEHTPKNLLLRAVRRRRERSDEDRARHWQAYQALKAQFNVRRFALEEALADRLPKSD